MQPTLLLLSVRGTGGSGRAIAALVSLLPVLAIVLGTYRGTDLTQVWDLVLLDGHTFPRFV